MKIDRVQVFAFRAPTPAPVKTSFGTMRDRPAVFVRVTDSDGAFGWGEIFANWPAAGAEHRAQLLAHDISPLVLGVPFRNPPDLWRMLDTTTRIRAIQCGEPGPFAHVLAGLDTAVHDLAARRDNQPLSRWLSADARREVPVYASGIAITRAAEQIGSARMRGITRFKVKIGLGGGAETEALAAQVADCAPDERLFADANQAWDLETALQFVSQLPGRAPGWLEEPLAADSPAQDWAELARASPVPLAAGENIAGHDAFHKAVSSGSFGYLQPDVAKWGGVSGCFDVAQSALAAGQCYCPHFLGGGIGLQASAHLLAAAGGPGLLELDANPNPLRDAFFDGDPARGGHWRIGPEPGLGITELPEEITRFRTLALDLF